MARRKFSHNPRSDRATTAFATAAEAWFWGMQCLAAQAEGARFRADQSAVSRPCEPDDLLVSVEHMMRAGRLGAAHLRTLFGFGRRLAPPDPRCREEAQAARLWDEALDRLTTTWRQKGIVA
ncbi:MAG TPA: hypothetical protein VIF14_07240 [Alphaproteobacteria bacterium]|jgi:hypothetical protein